MHMNLLLLILAAISNTPSQAGEYMSYAFSFSQTYEIVGLWRDLVKILASWSLELMNEVMM